MNFNALFNKMRELDMPVSESFPSVQSVKDDEDKKKKDSFDKKKTDKGTQYSRKADDKKSKSDDKAVDEGWDDMMKSVADKDDKSKFAKKKTDKGTQYSRKNDDKDTADKPKKLKEGLDNDSITAMLAAIRNGEMSDEEFISQLESDEYTDASMRDGEMGIHNGDTPSGHAAWDQEQADWEQGGHAFDDDDNAHEFESVRGAGPHSSGSSFETTIPNPNFTGEDDSNEPEELEVVVHYILSGSYSPASREEPAEYPDFEVTSVTTADGRELPNLDSETERRLADAAYDYAVSQDDGDYDDNEDDRARMFDHKDVNTMESMNLLAGLPPMGECQANPGMPQPDATNITINMTGSGKHGIRDLMNVLKDIEDGPDTAPSGEMMGDADVEPMDMPMAITKITGNNNGPDEGFANAPAAQIGGQSGPEVKGVSSVIRSGNDMHKSKPGVKHAYRSGDNPMSIPTESIKSQLESLYQEIKGR